MQDFKHIQLIDEDTGIMRDWFVSDCPNCETKGSTYLLAYYKKEDKTLQIDENNYYCIACDMESEPKTRSLFMKKQIEMMRKERDKLNRYPDEQLANAAMTLKSNNPEMAQIFYIYIKSPEAKNVVDLMRSSKRYKRYPRSITDDDRLILTFFIYTGHFDWESIGVQKGMLEFVRILREEKREAKNDS
jgi:hypothetical protein